MCCSPQHMLDKSPTDLVGAHVVLGVKRMRVWDIEEPIEGHDRDRCDRGAEPGECPLPRLEPLACRTPVEVGVPEVDDGIARDRKSTRLNSSHVAISYAV